MQTLINHELLNNDEPFFVADLDVVESQHMLWKSEMPRVHPYYAVKCNPDARVIEKLAALGANFDCASRAEIDLVLSLGVDASRIIYANPCKQGSSITYAKEKGINVMTFDNEDELVKVQKHFPEAELVLRILTDDSKSKCQLGLKFGASMERAEKLIMKAKSMDLNVVGISFHVGSNCGDIQSYQKAIQSARNLFDMAENVCGYKFKLLDIGGGFPGLKTSTEFFKKIAEVCRSSIDRLFGEDIKIISEPGRFYVAGAYTLVVQVTSRRIIDATAETERRAMYYLNDGVYGSFNCLIFDHVEIEPIVFQRHESTEILECSLWGPTCDSMDCLVKKTKLPLLEVGDFLIFEDMGAYTLASSSTFNGFSKPNVVYVNKY
ncbi:hypothetical protein ROZALSC1DRAFT_10641 [Rozella allomycis CSF55]|uniref:ornithine decarboxylase n=1 Tax=Rozella allomycis (strain CSF55) TaxID=988480 RepID=A0A4P9YR15_ROZAC|nr:hypothetical protein ROZALSC1DRAFT_10641 [Rozella allomycis CSF55]